MEDYLLKSVTAQAIASNIISIVSVVLQTLETTRDYDNTLGTPILAINRDLWIFFAWSILASTNSYFSFALLFGIQRRRSDYIKSFLNWTIILLGEWTLAVVIYSCIFAFQYRNFWLLVLPIPIMLVSIILFTHVNGYIVILYTIIVAEKKTQEKVEPYDTQDGYKTEKHNQKKIDTILQGCAESQNLIDMAQQMEGIVMSNFDSNL